MSEANQQYHQLHAGWLRCRTLNPLVYDLSNCGVRGKCADGKFASEQPMRPRGSTADYSSVQVRV